jgi:hypothetical protein
MLLITQTNLYLFYNTKLLNINIKFSIKWRKERNQLAEIETKIPRQKYLQIPG